MKSETNVILKLLDKKNNEECFEILAEVLRECDFPMIAQLVKNEWDSFSKACLVDDLYSEGDENAGVVSLRSLLNVVEGILKADNDDYICGDISFSDAVRLETDEEKEENGHDNGINWYTKDESVNIDEIKIEFNVD